MKKKNTFINSIKTVSVFVCLLAITILPFTNFWQASAAGTITGTVYYDYNGNGVRNTGSTTLANDNGTAGVVVTVYDAGGTARGTATSAASGAYTLTATGTGPYRLEFTSLPTGFSPSANGTNNRTTVRFIPDGNSVNDLGIVNNTIYSQDNPNIAVSLLPTGNPLGGGTNGTNAFLGVFPYNSAGTTAIPQTFNGTVLGATWGQAYQRATRRLYSSALVKRNVGLGSFQTDGSNGATFAAGVSGTGGIYVTNFAAATPAPAQFVNLQSLGVNTGNFAAARNLPAALTGTATDVAAFGLVGKMGIGDIDMSEDGNTLWAVNLNTRSLVSMNVTGGVVPTAATSYNVISTLPGAPVCTNGVLRPWGLAFRNSLGYLGAVCTAENAGGTVANLIGYVLSFNPANPNAGFTTVLTIPLNYTRGFGTDRATGSNVWFPWTDTYSDAAFRPGTINDGGAGGLVISRPTPILSDIEFDNNGAMIIGFTDRVGNQFGNLQPRPIANDTTLVVPATGGEILRAQSNGAGGYALENNGAVTGFTGAGVGNTQGPGGGEFYANDSYNSPNHQETGQGGLAQLQGGNLATTESDPLSYNAGGIGWMDNTNGANPRDYQLYITDGTTPGTQGKANGLGDIELLSNPAPIEIGNRVWRDLDGDGVQDANEVGIAGVTVRLYNAAGVVVATAVTDANGEYFFSSAAGTSTANTIYGLGLLPNTGYSIRLDNPVNYAVGGPLNGIFLTLSNQTSQAGNKDGSDSDAFLTANPVGSPAGNFPVITITTGAAGANDHTYDFGFSSAAPTAATVTISGRVLDHNGRGIGSARLTLTNQTGAQKVVTTNSFGYFTFSEVLPGQSMFVNVNAKRYSFSYPNQFVAATEDVENLYFISDN